MRVKMFDHDMLFTLDNMKSLVDAGSEIILTQDRCDISQQSDKHFAFDHILAYVTRAREAGFKQVQIITPQSAPYWMPDDWFLVNTHGHCASLRYNFSIKNWTTCLRSHKITSYWCKDAEQYQETYVKALTDIVAPLGGSVIGATGVSGQCFFTSEFLINNLLKEKNSLGPWYFDRHATKAWKESGIADREQWWQSVRPEIIERRMSWGNDRTSCLFEYCSEYDAWRRGNKNVRRDLLAMDPRPERIMFTMFNKRILPRVMATDYFNEFRAWVGGEGTRNLAKHARWFIEQGVLVEGMLCGPLFKLYENVIDEQAYAAVAEAVKLC